MPQLHKIYIENFKGVYNPTIISFDSQKLTILNGPNGFGKTTIFDVVELCLRGKLERTMTYNEVTKKHSGHKKPFYQNKKNQDVILKIWLKENEDDHIIIKRLDKNSDGKQGTSRPFRPDSWQLLKTYYTRNTFDFDRQPDFNNVEAIEQDYIDRLFFNEANLSLSNLYPLFNYLQQEDNIYFLRKDEDKKKNELSFLFQTQKEDQGLEKANEVLNLVSAIREALSLRINQLGDTSSTDTPLSYNQLFPENSYPFDQEDPFQNIPGDQISRIHDEYQSIVQILSSFSVTFKVQEYNKQKLKTQLRSVVANSILLQSLVLQYLLPETAFQELKRKIDLNKSYTNFKDRLLKFEVNEQLLLSLGFDQEFITRFTLNVVRRQNLSAQLGEIGLIIRELNNSRQTTMAHFGTLHDKSPQPCHCPLCDAEWRNMESLYNAVEQKTRSLSNFNNVQQTELDQLEGEIISLFITPISTTIENHLSMPENIIEPDFYLQVSERRGNLDAINRFMIILAHNRIDVSQLLINEPVSISKLNENVQQLKELLQAEIDKIVVDESSLVDANLFVQYYNEQEERLITIEHLTAKKNYLTQKYNNTKIFSLNILNERLSKIKLLEDRLLSIKNQFGGAIKEYKKTMIEKIKIPFYIYSGKILQHYQQGYGIFVDVKDTTSRVRFLTAEDTDHDIIHQLSSGQLAVVSIAFCLALNKVYEVHKHFKFLAIDDPVQTLDDLNIHSFIELLRHEFSDYQMVISTHEENVANYMTYKFGKFQFDCNKLNVQKIFYTSQID